MKKLAQVLSLLVLAGVTSAAYAQTACSKNPSGAITETGRVDCTVQPTDYQVTIYKIGVCTGTPPAATTSAALSYSNCSVMYDNPSGATVSIAQGGITDLPGTFVKPAQGSYTSAFVEMSPNSTVKGVNTFANLVYGNASGQVSSGQYCWSAGGEMFAYSSGTPSGFAQCGTSQGTPLSSTTRMNGFNGAAIFSYSNTVNGVAVNAYLVKNDYKLPASGSPSVDNGIYRMIGVANTPVTIGANTSSMDVGFDVSNGSVLTMYMSGGSQSVQMVYGYTIGPFAPIFTVR